jgi:hypothetical protein
MKDLFFFFLFFDTNEKRLFIAGEELQPTSGRKAGGKRKEILLQ